MCAQQCLFSYFSMHLHLNSISSKQYICKIEFFYEKSDWRGVSGLHILECVLNSACFHIFWCTCISIASPDQQTIKVKFSFFNEKSDLIQDSERYKWITHIGGRPGVARTVCHVAHPVFYEKSDWTWVRFLIKTGWTTVIHQGEGGEVKVDYTYWR